jgi:hypothetical protein
MSYTHSRNTPFQGLAADGAKLALWRLTREGYRVIGFVHDEILIEVPDEGGFVSKHVVDRSISLMTEAMESVLGGDIPVECEATLSTCWSKAPSWMFSATGCTHGALAQSPTEKLHENTPRRTGMIRGAPTRPAYSQATRPAAQHFVPCRQLLRISRTHDIRWYKQSSAET